MSDGRHTSELRSVSRCRMRARSSTWARRADRSPAYRRGANYRTYKPRAPYHGARKWSWVSERCIFNEPPPGPGAQGPNDATTISETNPLMINKGIRQPRWTRERLADNVSAEYSWAFSTYKPWRRWKRHRPGCTGKRAYCDIDLSFAHSDYRSAIL